MVYATVKFILKSILHPKLYGWISECWHKTIRKDEGKPSEPIVGWRSYVSSGPVDIELREMLLFYEDNKKETGISNYWKELNSKNISQLIQYGFDNFKQTVALNYFTNIGDNDREVKYLRRNLSSPTIAYAKKEAKKSPKHLLFTTEQSMSYNLITLMLWEFTKQEVSTDLLRGLGEPLVGNSPAVYHDEKWISQDLAYSILEYKSMMAGADNFRGIKTVLEVGAGYGRSAYVVLSLNPSIRYIIADIPPALYISQKYLSTVFPNKRIFRFRDFKHFAEIEREFFSSDIIFIMPHQLQKLPRRSVDLCVAIDCLHEMLPSQLDFYFKAFDMLGRHLYFKCWKEVTIPYDNVLLTERDYPVCSHWRNIFWKECIVQSYYFEAFFSWGHDQ